MKDDPNNTLTRLPSDPVPCLIPGGADARDDRYHSNTCGIHEMRKKLFVPRCLYTVSTCNVLKNPFYVRFYHRTAYTVYFH